ncbi:PAP2 superfamily protein [Collimonas sp. OK242]|jgi:membrane-associated phospholipid phosphatase|uniref:phosphatase PAP2 family protein n=1 Tax=Collimonas sp. OK242 TaxID=1798195 RepID=UPI0008958A43|nr:phosphatase PAP2 family protein [Collimonas sp. OK242]SDX28233.1 PAP2 superfamily protein [Collimonas sp. OK242]
MFEWTTITKIGGSTIMLPAAAAIAAWLLAARAWRAFWVWCLLFGGALLLVAASKIAFAGWGIGIEALDFRGFSGHAMRAAAIIPLLFYLVLQQQTTLIRRTAAVFGMCFAVLVSFSRVWLDFHSVSEALSGWLMGSTVCLAFIWQAERLPKPSLNRALITASFVLLLAASFARPIPTQRLIEETAQLLTGHAALAAESRRHAVEKSSERPGTQPAS